MAASNPVTRANYEPNSWPAHEGGPREDQGRGFASYPADESGPKRRLRAESFADHYSQARQFWLSQTEIEQQHIGDAFTFELSKCDSAVIRTRMVAGLRNVHEDLARYVATGLGLAELPAPAPAAQPVNTSLAPSPALSIDRNGPKSFAGRKIGILVTVGADAAVLTALQEAAAEEQATVEFVAPTIGLLRASDGSTIEPEQKVDGGPSVLYDAVVIAPSEQGAVALADNPAARDFVSDAYAHCKFIGYSPSAGPLLSAAGVDKALDDGFVPMSNGGAAVFVEKCREVRYWQRQQAFSR
jgi:catalase